MLDKVARKLLQPINTSLILLIGLYNFLTGLWFVLPFDSASIMFGTYEVSEIAIGSWLLVIGFITIISVIKNKYSLLVSGSGMSFVSWMAAWIFLLINNFTGVGWITALVIAGYCGLIFINLRVNQDIYDND